METMENTEVKPNQTPGERKGDGETGTANKNAACGSTESQVPEAPRPEPTPAAPAAEYTPEQLNGLTAAALADLCKKASLPVKGKKADLIKRLLDQRLGGRQRAIPNHTLCQFCGCPAYITHSKVAGWLKDGRYIKQYRIQCSGPRGHRYTIKQTEGVASAAAQDRREVRHGR